MSNLNAKHDLKVLKDMAAQFQTLSETQQREVYTSLKIGEA